MKILVYTQLRTILRKKVCFLLILAISIYFLFQGLRLRQYFYIYELKGNALDFFFFTIGGWQSPLLFSFILGWSFLILVLLYLSVFSSTSIEEFGGIILNRIQSRVNLWATICITQFLLSLIFFVLIVIVYNIVSYILFDFKLALSPYTFEFYESWAKSNIPIKMIIFLICMIFISGLYSLFMLTQVILNLSLNRKSIYISFIFISIATGFFYIYTGLSRIFSPIFYPSTISIEFNLQRIWLIFVFHIVIAISCIVIGGFLYKKKSFY